MKRQQWLLSARSAERRLIIVLSAICLSAPPHLAAARGLDAQAAERRGADGPVVRAGAPSPAANTRHLVVISIDGFRPAVYLHPESESVHLPVLLSLRDKGVYADRMVGVFPSITYPSHTTLVTGTRPASHGIVTNFHEQSGVSSLTFDRADWRLAAREIKDETLWQAARKAGLTTAIVTWPVSYGADVDWLIPENLSNDQEDVAAAIRDGATPGLFDQLEKETQHFELKTTTPDRNAVLDRMTAAFAAQVIHDHKPNLILIHFLNTDSMQHEFGPYSPQSRQAYETVDRQIGSIVKAVQEAGIEDSTDVVVTGDHGFAPVHTAINLTFLLKAIGYASLVHGRLMTKVVDVVHTDAACVFFPKKGATTAQLALFNRRLKRYVEARFSNLITVLSRKDLEREGSYPGAVSGLTPQLGYWFMLLPYDDATIAAGGGTHGYLPEIPEMATGFIASGEAFAEQKRIAVLRSVDVAPTLARVLGVPMPRTEGVPILGILSEAVNKPATERLEAIIGASTNKYEPTTNGLDKKD